MRQPLSGYRIERALLSACRDRDHQSCVHLVDDIAESGTLVIRTEQILHACTCRCHSSCVTSPDLEGKSVIEDGGVEKDRCSCWETRHGRQLRSGDRAPADDDADDADADADDAADETVDDDSDGRMISIGRGMDVSLGCLVTYPFLLVACAAALVGAHYSHGYLRDGCWLVAGLLLLVIVPMSVVFLIGWTSRVVPGRVVFAALAVAFACGLGAVVGAGVATLGPGDFAISALIAAGSVQVFRGYGPAGRLPRRPRRAIAGYVLVCAVASAATGAAILAFG